LRNAIQTSPSLRISFLKFVQAFGVQTSHTAISKTQSKTDIRFARWLLMAHDRMGGDTLPLTHEFLSLMLAVRRAGVTDALNLLRKQEIISYQRGKSQYMTAKEWSALQAKPTVSRRNIVG
jgi:CRP-like cAMP-binding protein